MDSLNVKELQAAWPGSEACGPWASQKTACWGASAKQVVSEALGHPLAGSGSPSESFLPLRLVRKLPEDRPASWEIPRPSTEGRGCGP